MKTKKLISLLCILVLLILSITGCSKKKEKNSTPNLSPTQATSDSSDVTPTQASTSPEGRFIDERIDVPDEFYSIDYSFYLAHNPASKDALVTYYLSNNNSPEFLEFSLKADGTWKKTSLDWIKDFLPKEYDWIQSMDRGMDGKLYILTCHINPDQSAVCSLYKQTKDKSLKQVNLKYLSEKNSNGKYPYPSFATADKTGNIYLANDSSLIGFDKDSLKQTISIEAKEYLGKFAFKENNLYVNSSENKTIDVYDISTGQKIDSISYESNFSDSAYNFSDDDMYLATHEGIFTLQPKNTIWEMVIDGSSSVLADSTASISSIVKGTNDDYYCMISSNGTLMTYHCYYSTDASAIPDTTLTIYSLYDSDNVRKAISLFQQQHKDVRVSFQPVTTAKHSRQREEADVSDAISTLNTELLANNGSDLMILDGLPYQSYIEKGILDNIYDYLPELKNDFDYLPNILKASEQDGNVYALPTSFRYFMIDGTDEMKLAATNIHSLAQYIANGHEETLSTWLLPDLIKLIMNSEAQRLFYSDTFMSQNDMQQLFTDLKTIKEKSKNIFYKTEFETAGEATENADQLCKSLNTLNTAYITSLYNGLSSLGIANERGSHTSSLNNQFEPIDMISINKSSPHKELAADFIKILLSRDVQNIDLFSNYFPVATSSIDEMLEMEDEHVAGGPMNYLFRFPKKEYRKEVIDTCKSLTTPISVTKDLYDIYYNAFLDFLQNDKDPSSTANELYNKMELYFSE